MHGRILPLALAVAVALVALPPAPHAQETKGQPTRSSPASPERGENPTPRAAGSTGRLLVGDQAPDINLKDAEGKSFDLDRLRKHLPWMIVFARFPDDAVLAEESEADFRALGVGVVIVAPFSRQRLARLVPNPRVALLFDRASYVARVYGLYDPVTGNPRPGAVLVDRRGHIQFIVSGGLPTAPELVRIGRDALEEAQSDSADAGAPAAPAPPASP